MSRHVTSCHVKPRHITSFHVMPSHATACYVTSCHVKSRHVTYCHVLTRPVTSCHVISCHVMSSHVTSGHVTSCHVMSRPVTSCHVGCPEGCRYHTASADRRVTCWIYFFTTRNPALWPTSRASIPESPITCCLRRPSNFHLPRSTFLLFEVVTWRNWITSGCRTSFYDVHSQRILWTMSTYSSTNWAAVLDRLAPIRTTKKRIGNRRSPDLSGAARKANQHRRACERRYRKSGSDDDRKRYD